MKNSKKGFTLIELLVVIAIIGILSSVVLASLNTARSKARDTSRITDVKQLQLALELYYDSNSSKYPTALSQLVPIYIQVEPKDPTTGNSYFYAYQIANQTDYHLGALLESNTSNVLNQDADRNTVTEGGFTNAFNGNSTDCAGGVGTDQCYDARS